MDAGWWAIDRELDPGVVARVVRSQFPELRAESVALLAEGWDSEIFEVDDLWLFRFPKRAEVQAAHDRERALLPLLAPRLPVEIPRFELLGEACELFPYRFVGYRKVPGTPAQLLSGKALSPRGEEAIARQLGEFLGALHGTEVPSAVELPELDPVYLARPIRGAEERLPHLHAASPPLAARLESFLEAAEAPRRPSAEGVLVHGDLAVENLLIDPEEERITGVIDWSEVKLGPPCGDFAALLGWRGERFLSRVLAHYPGPVDDRDLGWLRLAAIHVALRQVSYGRMAAKELPLRAGLHALELLLPR